MVIHSTSEAARFVASTHCGRVIHDLNRNVEDWTYLFELSTCEKCYVGRQQHVQESNEIKYGWFEHWVQE